MGGMSQEGRNLGSVKYNRHGKGLSKNGENEEIRTTRNSYLYFYVSPFVTNTGVTKDINHDC